MIQYNPINDIKLICNKLVELEDRISELEVTVLGLQEIKIKPGLPKNSRMAEFQQGFNNNNGA